MSKKQTKFFVYVDRTNDGKPFYVGKGNQRRIKSIARNLKHKNVSNKHGLNREIVFETLIEREAYEKEISTISELHTFVDDPLAVELACNYAPGGEGFTSDSAYEIAMRDTNPWRGEKQSKKITELNRLKGSFKNSSIQSQNSKKFYEKYTKKERTLMASHRLQRMWAIRRVKGFKTWRSPTTEDINIVTWLLYCGSIEYKDLL